MPTRIRRRTSAVVAEPALLVNPRRRNLSTMRDSWMVAELAAAEGLRVVYQFVLSGLCCMRSVPGWSAKTNPRHLEKPAPPLERSPRSTAAACVNVAAALALRFDGLALTV